MPLRVLLLSLLAFATPLPAQETGISLKIDFVAWGDEIGGLSFKASDKSSGITALAFRYSKPVAYSGPALMEIHKNGDGNLKPKAEATADDKAHELIPLAVEKPNPAADKNAPAKKGIALELERRRKEDPTLVALASLPPSSRHATVLLAPAPDGTYQAYVIDDDPAKLPLGKLRIHNLSPFPIAMRCNGQGGKEIKTSETLTVPAPNQQITYELAYKVGDEWKVQENNILPIRAAEQTQMVVLRSTNQFFLSADGSSGGFLQTVVLRRSAAQAAAAAASR